MGGIFCPAAGCGNGLLPEPGQRRIECNECKVSEKRCPVIYCKLLLLCDNFTVI